MADPNSREGHRYDTPEIRAFLDGLHGPHDKALGLAFSAPERTGLPQIQLGQQEGTLLTLLMRLIGARRVVEVGTLAGYSGLRLARGLQPGGRLWTLEAHPRHAMVARPALVAAPPGVTVKLLEGDAKATLPKLEIEGPFDAVFLDADKGGYAEYGSWAAQNLRTGGLLIADNVYLFGRLLEEGEEAEAVRRFHREAAEAFDTCVVPTPDGLLIGIRK
ncbi:MAG TPA: class I SAM-dependent methyltransferase [Holophagaceae bacterium]|nr:class I SAM-dependent methyltransferase [Holophagaceae bacterium]